MPAQAPDHDVTGRHVAALVALVAAGLMFGALMNAAFGDSTSSTSTPRTTTARPWSIPASTERPAVRLVTPTPPPPPPPPPATTYAPPPPVYLDPDVHVDAPDVDLPSWRCIKRPWRC